MDTIVHGEYFNFPPFFTLQPVRATREKQLAIWKEIVLQYHKANNQSLVRLATAPIFENAKISRKLDQEGRIAVMEYVIRCGYGAWEDETRTRCRIMWKKPAEWAAELYDYVSEHGMLGTVYTIYELYSGEETLGSQFHGLEPWLLCDALKILEDAGKNFNEAVILRGERSEEDGVKFIAAS